MNTLAIGAHPDDFELGCGGTLIKAARKGHNVSVYTLTRGGMSGEPAERTDLLEILEVVKLCLDKQLRLMKVPHAVDSVKRITEPEGELEYAWNKR